MFLYQGFCIHMSHECNIKYKQGEQWRFEHVNYQSQYLNFNQQAKTFFVFHVRVNSLHIYLGYESDLLPQMHGCVTSLIIEVTCLCQQFSRIQLINFLHNGFDMNISSPINVNFHQISIFQKNTIFARYTIISLS